MLQRSVVHQDLDRPDLRLDPVDGVGYPLGIRDVERVRVDTGVAEFLAEALTCLCEALGRHPVEDDRGARPGQAPREA